MSDSNTIVCKATPWFLLRAGAMLVMFGVFAVLFHRDATVGYPRKNAVYYLRATFAEAGDRLAKSSMTPEEWKEFAAAQTVKLPEDTSILPPEVKPGTPWPEVLQDAVALRDKQWPKLWQEYSSAWPHWKMSDEAPEKPFDAGKIREQWVVFWICLALALAAAFFFIRTWFRSIVVDGEGVVTQQGRRVPFADLKRLDLRKWATKGLAFADYEGASGKGRIRFDGMTYGGFNKDRNEPAERMMELVRARFSGELIDYAPEGGTEAAPPAESA